MILTRTDQPSHYDFVMEFYNPDGSGGMMCGNGGRCIVAFANYLGINPASGHTYHFLAPDGEHTAEILSQEIPGEKWTVRLKMIDVQGITPIKDGLFLNTGTRHYVQFVDRVDSIAHPLGRGVPTGRHQCEFCGSPGRWSPRPHLRERRGRGDARLRYRAHRLRPGRLQGRGSLR